MNKVYSLHDAVAKFVENGDCICFGGFTTNRKPYAAVSEILRQGQKDFTVWAGPAGGDWDMMIGEGRVKAYINCYTANSGYTNVSRRFRAAIEKGELTYEDYSQDVLMLQLHAASLGLPFLPVRLMQGSGLMKYWGIKMCIRDSHMALDGGEDGLDFYRFISAKWKSALRLGGTLLFEVGIGQAPEVEEILARNGFEDIKTTADTQGIWRVVEGTINS